MPEKQFYDVIIVGGGPAGCSAAIVLARSKRSVLVIDEGKHRNKASIGIHNYPTRDGILPADYHALVHAEMKHYHVNIVKSKVTDARILAAHGFVVTDASGKKYICRKLLLATGVTDNIPDIPGMKELWGRNIFHCPFCDGWECSDMVIGLYARQHGYGMALALRQFSKDVILFTDGEKYLRPKQRANLAHRGVKVISQRVVKLSQKNKTLTGVVLDNGETVPVDRLFVNEGHRVNNSLLVGFNCRSSKIGAAITNRHQQTNVPGLYVAGDASFDMHMVIVAAAEGAKAAVAIHEQLLKTDNELPRGS
jgi:thioredoxin reductase